MRASRVGGLARKGLNSIVGRTFITGLAAIAMSVAPVVAAPANDRKRDATPIQTLPYSATQVTEGATAHGERQPSCASAGQIVWFTMTSAPNNFVVQASGYDTVLAVYEDGGGDKEIACDNDSGFAGGSTLTLTGQAGKTLYFAVGVCCDKKATTTSPLFFGVF